MTHKYIKIYGTVLLESNVINHFRKRFVFNLLFPSKNIQLV